MMETGCDIHMTVEVKGVDDKWFWHVPGNDIYDIRNYDAFAQLADVRNGSGFAGVKTGDGFEPISEPRGLPDDLSPGLEQKINHRESDDEFNDKENHFWIGDHSFSHLALDELLEYRKKIKTMKTVQTGFVTMSEYKDFKEKGRPGSYCGGTFGIRIVKVSNAEMDDLITGKKKPENNKLTLVKWDESYISAASDFWGSIDEETGEITENGTIKKLEDIAAEFNVAPDHVRIVFGFDS